MRTEIANDAIHQAVGLHASSDESLLVDSLFSLQSSLQLYLKSVSRGGGDAWGLVDSQEVLILV